jgi:hypothetical protein
MLTAKLGLKAGGVAQVVECLLCKGETLAAGHWWLTPVTLATQEAEITRMAVHRTLPFQKYSTQNWGGGVAQEVECLCSPSTAKKKKSPWF